MMATHPATQNKKPAMPRTMPNTWSASRDQILQECEHKYYFRYLAGAKLGSTDLFLRELALLKKLKTAVMWQGELFHWAVAECCNTRRANKPIPKSRLFETLEQKIEREWKFSETHSYRTRPYDIEKCGLALFEHEYAEMSELANPHLLYSNVTRLLEKFFKWAGGEVVLPRRVGEAEQVWIEAPAFGPTAPGFHDCGVQVIAKVDLALQEKDGRFEIFDWKTAKAPDRKPASIRHNDLQVNIYQLWPLLKMKQPADSIFSRVVYFGGAEPVDIRFDLNEESISITRGIVQDSIALAERWRRDVEEGRMTLEDLDYAQNEWTCHQCSFKKVCRERLTLTRT
jgi:hypothetical protein